MILILFWIKEKEILYKKSFGEFKKKKKKKSGEFNYL